MEKRHGWSKGQVGEVPSKGRVRSLRYGVHPTEEHAIDAADGFIDTYGQLSQMEFKQFVDRDCDYCQHMMGKDD